MAKFNSDKQTGVYIKVQELIVDYISSLEDGKLAESKTACRLAEESKNAQVVAERNKKVAEDKLLVLEDEIKKLSTELEKLKVIKNSELDKLDESVKAKKKAIDTIRIDNELVCIEIEKVKNELDILLAQKDKAISENRSSISLVAENKLKLDSSGVEIKESIVKLEKLNRDIAVSKVLSDKLGNDNNVLLKEAELCKVLLEKSNNETLEKQEELQVSLAKIALEKASAEKELEKVKANIKKNNEELLVSRQAIEKELLFIKEMNGLNLQKTKEFNYSKDKLQKIITKLILEVEGSREADLKNLLLVVKKL